jgi:hypothetical protein
MYLHIGMIHTINSDYFLLSYEDVFVRSGNLNVYFDVSMEYFYDLPGNPLSVCEGTGTVIRWALNAEAQVRFHTNTLRFAMGKESMAQAFLSLLQFSPLVVIPPMRRASR